ncbi:DUF3021 family protein [Clostridium sp. SHJSY1]|uniref:DUF3021 family protein n=1 Tax=Clostridium sp. SHJSY1 TaxID=2942483 RepID=UPI00287510B3|nr:DUF3021 family protein [Clostridium sp. SHJSY1]MDS0527055.1 DUF3021 family protein [Clostridium sp. SHJSY1]
MKKFNQYFYGGCVAFTVMNIITIILHIINHEETINVKSQISLIAVILLVQIVLYLTENIEIKYPPLQIFIDFIITVIITFVVGLPTKLLNIFSAGSVIEIIIIISIVYVITFLSLYKNSTNDANDINKKLQENK